MNHGKYVGAFNFVMSPNDVKINFISIDPLVDNNNAIAGEEREIASKVIISLPLAKQLVNNLLVAINQYEKDIGPVIDLNQMYALDVNQSSDV